MEEPSSEYWVLHKWLFTAYLLGHKETPGCMRRDVAMTCLLGPDWPRKEEELMVELIASDPGLKDYYLKTVMERIPEQPEEET